MAEKSEGMIENNPRQREVIIRNFLENIKAQASEGKIDPSLMRSLASKTTESLVQSGALQQPRPSQVTIEPGPTTQLMNKQVKKELTKLMKPLAEAKAAEQYASLGLEPGEVKSEGLNFGKLGQTFLEGILGRKEQKAQEVAAVEAAKPQPDMRVLDIEEQVKQALANNIDPNVINDFRDSSIRNLAIQDLMENGIDHNDEDNIALAIRQLKGEE